MPELHCTRGPHRKWGVLPKRELIFENDCLGGDCVPFPFPAQLKLWDGSEITIEVHSCSSLTAPWRKCNSSSAHSLDGGLGALPDRLEKTATRKRMLRETRVGGGSTLHGRPVRYSAMAAAACEW